MRKLFWQISVTLDGFMEGPDKGLDDTAGYPDPDFEKYAAVMLAEIGDIVIGRRTYDLFVSYWPYAEGPDALLMNRLPKHVASRTLRQVEWENATLVAGDVTDHVRKLKEGAGRDIALFGSADLANHLLEAGLVDEIRVLMTPVLLGRGSPAFSPATRQSLKLIREERWEAGTVMLCYQPSTESRT